jgi:hypothetical protein
MNRSRKRRINNEGELLEAGISESSGAASTSRGRVNFMEEVNYKMEENA